ncbi:MAG TPA: hypothetical protein VHD90_00590, partial [Phototrophicaceae bacterium]|nr:hypothetical protein [Phototrophicaceae bacterium]
MITFDNDEQEYLRWVHNYPTGFVINASKHSGASEYCMLHRASCAFVSTAQRTNYTTTTYKKICSLDRQELSDWGRKNSNHYSECKMCKP